MKKGFVMSGRVVTLVLTLLTILFISGNISGCTTEISEDNREVEAFCWETVDLRSKAVIRAGSSESPQLVPLACPVIDKVIEGKTVQETMQELADLSVRCWWMYHRGEIEGVISSFDGDNKGKVCYSVLIKDIEEDDSFSGRDFLNFLKHDTEHKDLKDVDGIKDDSYLTYIQESGGAGRIMLLLTEGEGFDEVSRNGKFVEHQFYDIAFIEKKGESDDWLYTKMMGGGAAGAALGVATLATGGTVGGVLLAGAGVYALVEGAEAKIEDFKAEKDVSTLMIVDRSSKKSKELHRNVLK